MLDFKCFSSFFLKCVTTYTIAICAFLLFIFSKKKNHSGLIYLLFLTMIYNTILKYIFQCPLPETCPISGFGFPSGHMNFDSVFYIWMIIHNKNILTKFILLAILCFTGWSIVNAGFHYPRDIIITPLFSATTILLYKNYIERLGEEKIFCIVSSISMLFLIILFRMKGNIEPHITLAYYIIIGFGGTLVTFQKNKLNTITKAIILCSIALIISLDINSYTTLHQILGKTKWLLLGCFVSLLKILVLRFQKTNNTQVFNS